MLLYKQFSNTLIDIIYNDDNVNLNIINPQNISINNFKKSIFVQKIRV